MRIIRASMAMLLSTPTVANISTAVTHVTHRCLSHQDPRSFFMAIVMVATAATRTSMKVLPLVETSQAQAAEECRRFCPRRHQELRVQTTEALAR
jgi:hypothetical protein